MLRDRKGRLGWSDGAEEFVNVCPCTDCEHHVRFTTCCRAFPDGIPHEILIGAHRHRDPYPGDGGTVWTKRKS